MSFGKFQHSGSSSRPLATMADINVTPMVDVMLVLLVIFIIAAPFMAPTIQLDLPQTRASALPGKGEAVHIAFDAKGVLYWEKQALSMAELETRLAALAQQNAQAELQLRADKATRYEIIAQVMAAAQAQGLAKISFVTENKLQKK